MRYLDYCFDKPILPSPLGTLEILCLVVLTLNRYHNIRKGARGDRFFGSRSIAAIFPLEKWTLIFLSVFRATRTELRLWHHFLKLTCSSTALYHGFSTVLFICVALFEWFWAVEANRTCLFGVNFPMTDADFISVYSTDWKYLKWRIQRNWNQSNSLQSSKDMNFSKFRLEIAMKKIRLCCLIWFLRRSLRGFSSTITVFMRPPP